MQIVIDSSVLVALLVPNDKWNTQAESLRASMKTSGHEIIYLDCVVTEAISTAIRRLSEAKRWSDIQPIFEVLTQIVPDHSITWILPDTPLLYADCLALMKATNGELNFQDTGSPQISGNGSV